MEPLRSTLRDALRRAARTPAMPSERVDDLAQVLGQAARRRSVALARRRFRADLALAAALGLAAGAAIHAGLSGRTTPGSSGTADRLRLAGDLDADGRLAMNDVLILATAQRRGEVIDVRHDLDADGLVTTRDVALLEQRVLGAATERPS